MKRGILLASILLVIGISWAFLGVSEGEGTAEDREEELNLQTSPEHKFERPKYAIRKDSPNIIVITIESLPAYRLGCTGYRRDTMPNLCDFAEQNTMYTRAYSPGAWTPTSMTGIGTGRYPSEVGIKGFTRMIEEHGKISYLHENVTRMSEFLKQSGYETYSHGNLKGSSERGFEHKISEKYEMEEVLEDSEKPVFAKIHYFETHKPYSSAIKKARSRDENFPLRYLENDSLLMNGSTRNKPQNKTQINNLYDDNLRAADAYFVEEVLEEIKKSGEYNESLIVITADHGELLGKNGELGHGNNRHYEEIIHVPLFVKYPSRNSSSKVDRIVSTIDILPTLLEEAEIPYDEEVISGVPLNRVRDDRKIFVDSEQANTVITEDHKFSICIQSANSYCGEGNSSKMYRYTGIYTAEPFSGNGTVEEKLRRVLTEHKENSSANMLKEVENSELKKQLEELGYLE